MNNINLSLSDNTSVIDLMADVDIEVVGQNEEDTVDFATLVAQAVFARSSGKATLCPGKYNIRLLCVITRNEENNVGTTGDSSGDLVNQNISGSSTPD